LLSVIISDVIFLIQFVILLCVARILFVIFLSVVAPKMLNEHLMIYKVNLNLIFDDSETPLLAAPAIPGSSTTKLFKLSINSELQ